MHCNFIQIDHFRLSIKQRSNSVRYDENKSRMIEKKKHLKYDRNVRINVLNISSFFKKKNVSENDSPYYILVLRYYVDMYPYTIHTQTVTFLPVFTGIIMVIKPCPFDFKTSDLFMIELCIIEKIKTLPGYEKQLFNIIILY